MKILFIAVQVLFLPVAVWGTTYYVSLSGSNTSPYDTEAKAANSPRTVIDQIDSDGVEGPHTVYIAAGVYSETSGYMYLDSYNQAHSFTTIIGAGRGNTIIDPDTGHTILGSNSNSNITVKDLTLRTASTKSQIVCKTDGCSNWTFENVDFVADDNAEKRLIWLLGDETKFHNCRVYGIYEDGDEYPLYAEGDSSIEMINCILKAKTGFDKACGLILYGSGTNDIYNSIFFDSYSAAITVNNGTTNIMNCIVDGCYKHLSNYTILKVGGTLNIENSWVADNPYCNAGIDPSTDNNSNNIETHINPQWRGLHGGIIIPCIDDTGNLASAEFLETLLAEYGYTGTFFVEVVNVNTQDEKDRLRSLISNGTIEIGLHSYSHSDMTLTDRDKIFDVTKDGETITIDRSVNTISLSDVESIFEFKGKSLATIKSELEGLGATVTPTSLYATGAAVDKIQSVALGEVIASGASTNQINILVTDTTEGLYKSEMVDAKATLEDTIINGDGNIIDPQTGLTYTVNSWAAPYNRVNDLSRSATIDTGFELARHSENSFLVDMWYRDIDMYKVEALGGNTITGADEAATRSIARKMGLMLARKGGILVAMGHGTGGDITTDEWEYLIDEWSKIPELQIMSAQLAADYIKNSGSWTDDGDGTYSKTLSYSVFEVNAGSSLINAGTNPFSDGDGNQTDFNGKPVWNDDADSCIGPWYDGVEIGPYGCDLGGIYEIKIIANDSAGGPITIEHGDLLTVQVFLNPGTYQGQNADWWVVADTPFGSFCYDLTTWYPGLFPVYQGPLFILNPFTVFNYSSLPIGTYVFYFGVDGNMNAILDGDQIYYDSVSVTVQ